MVAELGKNIRSLNPQYQTDNTIGCGDLIELETNACGMRIHYALEYQIRDTSGIVQAWSEALSYGLRSAPSLSIADFPNLLEGQILDIRLRYSENQSNDTNDYSDILTLVTGSCSPELLSFLPINTSCSYTDDGGFSMILDRDLESGEKLVASLFYEFNPITEPNVFSLADQKDTTTLIDNGDNTFTYQWPSDTPILPGNYKVRYQTQDSTALNPEWNSLEGTERGFTIGSPTPVTFSGTRLNNVFCNGGSDGAIRLDASGGVGNYEYQVNGSNWLPFDNTNTHLINTFSSGTYSIKVRDANECTERN